MWSKIYHGITLQFLTKIISRFQRKKNRLKQENIHILHMVILKKNSEELQSCVIRFSLEVYYLIYVLG